MNTLHDWHSKETLVETNSLIKIDLKTCSDGSEKNAPNRPPVKPANRGTIRKSTSVDLLAANIQPNRS